MPENKQHNNETNKNQILKGEEHLLLDHDYDGIQELDHPLPGWWLAILYLTIAFAVAYSGYYLTGVGPTLKDEFLLAMSDIEAKKPKVDSTELTDDVIVASFKSPDKLQHGGKVFAEKCAACHGQKGEGLIGPNLTDDAWIHGDGTPKAIAGVIKEGVAEKGMPPWGPVLAPDELVDVAAYIRSLHGTNPPNAKEPQGNPTEFKEL